MKSVAELARTGAGLTSVESKYIQFGESRSTVGKSGPKYDNEQCQILMALHLPTYIYISSTAPFWHRTIHQPVQVRDHCTAPSCMNSAISN